VAVSDLALERALVADPVLATVGVDRWLAPLADAPRGGRDLVRTLAAWLESGQSVTATSRALAVAPRTVSYRLARIAALLGVRSLDAEVVTRLSAALLLARLLATDRVASVP
jgi:sugar diacid utilization regulator